MVDRGLYDPIPGIRLPVDLLLPRSLCPQKKALTGNSSIKVQGYGHTPLLGKVTEESGQEFLITYFVQSGHGMGFSLSLAGANLSRTLSSCSFFMGLVM